MHGFRRRLRRPRLRRARPPPLRQRRALLRAPSQTRDLPPTHGMCRARSPTQTLEPSIDSPLTRSFLKLDGSMIAGKRRPPRVGPHAQPAFRFAFRFVPRISAVSCPIRTLDSSNVLARSVASHNTLEKSKSPRLVSTHSQNSTEFSTRASVLDSRRWLRFQRPMWTVESVLKSHGTVRLVFELSVVTKPRDSSPTTPSIDPTWEKSSKSARVCARRARAPQRARGQSLRELGELDDAREERARDRRDSGRQFDPAPKIQD